MNISFIRESLKKITLGNNSIKCSEHGGWVQITWHTPDKALCEKVGERMKFHLSEISTAVLVYPPIRKNEEGSYPVRYIYAGRLNFPTADLMVYPIKTRGLKRKK